MHQQLLLVVLELLGVCMEAVVVVAGAHLV
jgi:hypothetical protein